MGGCAATFPSVVLLLIFGRLAAYPKTRRRRPKAEGSPEGGAAHIRPFTIINKTRIVPVVSCRVVSVVRPPPPHLFYLLVLIAVVVLLLVVIVDVLLLAGL